MGGYHYSEVASAVCREMEFQPLRGISLLEWLSINYRAAEYQHMERAKTPFAPFHDGSTRCLFGKVSRF
jgi:hypothetical protein